MIIEKLAIPGLCRKLVAVVLLAVLSAGCASNQLDPPQPVDIGTPAKSEPGPARLPQSVEIDLRQPAATVTVASGGYLQITCSSEGTGHVRLVDIDSGAFWYTGSASDLNLRWWAIRPGDTRLQALVEGHEAQSFTIRTVAGVEVFYPGLELRIQRATDDTPKLPSPDFFAPPESAVGSLPSELPVYSQYPTFRTAESVLPSTDPTRIKNFRFPDYWHMVLPQPSFSDDPEQIEAWKAPLVHPAGDLKRSDAVADMRARLMVDKPGSYRFRITCDVPARLRVGGVTAENQVVFVEAKPDPKGQNPPLRYEPTLYPAELTVELPAGLADFGVTLDARYPVPTRLCVMWQPPGEADFVVLDGARFLHAVSAPMEAAYQTFTEGTPWRRSLDPVKGKTVAVEPDLSQAAAEYDAYQAASRHLLRTWQDAPGDADARSVARQLLDLTCARVEVMRQTPKQRLPSGGLIDGNTMVLYVELRSFLEACMSQPSLQADALRTRAAMHDYTAIVSARSFLSETHNGTNDGYGDHNNFLVNIWRAAAVWDDPVAMDMARSLCDNHFSYCAGTGNGMHSDGIWAFHNANGRHLNLGGYGHDWVTRVLNSRSFNTPWGQVPEQYRRLADFTLNWEWFFYKEAMAFTTAGRHNSHQGVFGSRFTDRLLALSAGALDAETRSALEKQKERLAYEQALEGNRFFFRHLQMIHRRSDYYLDVKMNSPLVGGIETFASYQPGNLAFGDGVATILKRGDEYRSIHAYNLPESLWRYRSLPGTTQLDYEYGDLSKWGGLDRYRGGGGSTAGGVSDGEIGHCAFDFVSHKNNATVAKKFFAFTDDGMMVLGSAITGSKPSPSPTYGYHSNINQCSFRTPARIVDDKGVIQSIAADAIGRQVELPLDRRYWIEHDGIAYLVFPTGSEAGEGKPGKLVIRTSMRTPINRMGEDVWANPKMAEYREKCEALLAADPPRQTPVLELWIDHGSQPTDATCAYFVCMRPETREAADWLANPPVNILANTPAVQAISDCTNGAVHAFFSTAGQISSPELSLTVDRAASVMLRPDGNGSYAITAQDPRAACTRDLTEMADEITLTIGQNGKQRTITLPMPGSGDPDDRYRGGMVQTRL